MPVATMTATAPQTATFQGIDRNDLAYKLVSKMGWEEGKGLGKDNKGIVKHIWTKKRNDQVGLGGEVGNDWGAHSIQTNTYNSLLSKLAVITNDSDSDSGSDSDAGVKSEKKKGKGNREKHGQKEGDSDSDENGGKRSKKDKKKKKQQRKAESSDSDSSDEDVSKAASASCDDYGSARKAGRSYAAAAVKESKEKKVQTNALRFAYKRAHLNKTKDVKSYSASDLSQILGFSVAPKEEDKALLARDGVKKYGKAQSTRSETSSSSDNEEEEEEEKAGAKKRKRAEGKMEAPAEGKRKGGIIIGSSKRKPMVMPDPSVLKGVLSHMFTHGGFLSGEPEKQKEQDWQFDEATQEKIAMDAHNNKVAGKKGLGFGSDRPSKLGKDYTGSKKTFDDDDDDGSEEDKAENPEAREEEEEETDEARKKRKKAEKKAKKAAAMEAAAKEEEEEEAVTESPEKKKKKKKAKADEEETAAVEEEEEAATDKKKKKKSKKQKAE